MPIANMLVDDASGYDLSFMDGHSGYNQIYITKDDVSKTTFWCPGAIGTYEWIIMPFGLKNAKVTYQKNMNTIFHDLIGIIIKVYIDNVVVKSIAVKTHLSNLK